MRTVSALQGCDMYDISMAPTSDRLFGSLVAEVVRKGSIIAAYEAADYAEEKGWMRWADALRRIGGGEGVLDILDVDRLRVSVKWTPPHGGYIPQEEEYGSWYATTMPVPDELLPAPDDGEFVHPPLQIFLFRSLARAFGHMWGGTPLPLNMRALSARQMRHLCRFFDCNYDGAGIEFPDPDGEGTLKHSTQTGRTRWSVRADGIVRIVISRPSGSVIEATVDPETRTVRVRRLNDNIPVFERHTEPLTHALIACEQILGPLMRRGWQQDDVLPEAIFPDQAGQIRWESEDTPWWGYDTPSMRSMWTPRRYVIQRGAHMEGAFEVTLRRPAGGWERLDQQAAIACLMMRKNAVLTPESAWRIARRQIDSDRLDHLERIEEQLIWRK